VQPLVTYRGTVYPWQCDHVGHMNITWYANKFDEANWNLFALAGLTPRYLRESGRGMAALEQRIAYRRELVAGDIVEVESRLLEVRPKVLRFVHEMREGEGGVVAAVCEIVAAHVDRRLRRACEIEPHVRAIAERLAAEGASAAAGSGGPAA